MQRAIALREAGRYKEAIAVLRGDSAPDLALLAQLLALDGQDEEAWTALRAAQIETPQSAEVRRTHARLLMKSGQCDKALAEADEAYRCDPDDPETILVLAAALASSGKPQAEAVVEQALHRRPDYAEALALRGMLRANPEDLEAALALKPHLTHLWAPLASQHHRAAHLDAAHLERAKVAYLNAIRAKPQADLHNNLGAILVEEGHGKTAALEHFDRAIALDPGLAQPHYNRGKALKDLGRLEEAEAACRLAIQLDPGSADAHHNLGNVLQCLDDAVGAKAAYLRTFQLAPSGVGLSAAVEVACYAFIERNLEQCRRLLEAASAIRGRPEPFHRAGRIFWQFLTSLLRQPQQQIGGDVLHVVGDSHSLSYAGVEIEIDGRTLWGAPTLVKGCKQFHLGNDTANQFKVQFDKVMARLGGPILLTVGEIDCRPNEGVFAHWRRNPDKDLGDLIDRTTSRFLDRVGRPVIISGVPAPTRGERDFLDCVSQFNASLRNHTLARGMRFLDVHGMTDRGDGLSNRRWHIDGRHLLPQATREAFSKHLINGPSARQNTF